MQALDDTLQQDIIKDISESQIGYFGGPGKMVCPSRATVEALVRRIPESRIITTDLLRQELAEQFNVQGACPVTTHKALQAIANDAAADPASDVAYWRVIKQSGQLIDRFPGGAEGQAALLMKEGFTIDSNGKAPKVSNFKRSLVHFTQSSHNA